MTDNSSKEEAYQKWKDVLQTQTGQTKEQVHQEINNLYAEQQNIDEILHQRAINDMRKFRIAYHNILNPNYDKDKSKLVPIDGDIKGGSQVFMLHCASCHSLELFKKLYRSDIHFQLTSGPSLAKIYDKPAGSNRDYMEDYTMELLKSKIFWNSYNLHRWVANPQLMVKGTKCMKGMKYIENPIDRVDIVKFLKSFTKQAADLDRKQFSKWLGYEWMNYREQGKQKAKEVALERQKDSK